MALDRTTIHDKVRLIALVIFVVSLPLSKAANNLSIVLLSLNFLFESSVATKWNRLKGNKMFFCFASLYLISLAGIIYTINIDQGARELEKKIALLVFPILLAASNPVAKSDLRTIFKFFIGTCFIGSIICLGYAVQRNYAEGHTLSYVYNAVVHDVHLPGRYLYLNYFYFTHHFLAEGIGMHPTYLALFIFFSSALLVWLWFDRHSFDEPMRKWMIVVLVYFFFIVVLLSSRTQLAITLLAALAFTLYYTWRRKILVRGLVAIAIVVAAGAALVLINPITRERLTKTILPDANYEKTEFGGGGTAVRTYNWKYSIETISHDPLFGAGLGDGFDELMKTYEKHDFKVGLEEQLNAHNQYLETGLEIGIIGMLSFIACLAYPGWMAWKTKNWLCLVFIGSFAISCITESMLELNKGIMYYSFFNALLAFHMLLRNE